MANKNFVVHNGLTVGALTIDAATGDINTSGNVNITGNLGVSQIAKNDSSVSINDTGSSSTVVVRIDGAIATTIDSSGINLPTGDQFSIASNPVLSATTLGAGVVNSSLTTVGNLASLSVAGAATVFGNLTVQGLTTLNGGTLTLGDANTDNVVFGADINSDVIPNANVTYNLGSSSARWKDIFTSNVTATLVTATTASITNITGTLQTASQTNITAVGNLTALSASGVVQTTGILYANSGVASASTTTGALVVIGGVGASGNINAGNVIATNLTGTLLTASQTNITAVGNLTALSASGIVRTTGQIWANAGIASTSTATGALTVIGGAGITGNAYVGTAIYIAGKTAATVDDATALSIALGG